MSEYREFGWDEGFSKDFSENDFTVLPEGDYDFTVESFERARHEGSDWIPACHKAVLKLRVDTEAGSALITHSLFLCTKDSCKRDIYRFFESIGYIKDGDDLRPNWNASALVGQKGRAHVIQRASKNDPSKIFNNVKNFLPPEPKQFRAGVF